MNRTRTWNRCFSLLVVLLLLAGCANGINKTKGIYYAQRGDHLYKKGEYQAAAVKLQQAAELDNTYANYRLYTMHRYGKGFKKSRTEAHRYLEKAASLGDETSQVILGSRLIFDKASERSRGVRLLEAAAAKENRYAYEYLALAYKHGLGVKRNSSRAKEYERLAAAQGSGTVKIGSSSSMDSSKLQMTKDIQRELKALGFYRGKVDGLYGPMTRDAIARYQKDYGFTVNPVVSKTVHRQVTERK